MTLNGAIMQLVEMRENSMMPMVFKPYFDKVIETISECEEPHSQPQWIPCSERLPEEKKEVLVSADGDLYIAILETINGELSWSEVIEYRYIMGVDAWMPLPKPYEKRE